jgi:hypothetical protein
MDNPVLSVIGSIATVALIVVATRWVSGSEGSLLPNTRDGSSIYGIKWQWRAVGFTCASFAAAIAIWSWYDLNRPEWRLIVISAIFVLIGSWVASGSVITNQSGITKRLLWYSRCFQWEDIAEVRLHKKQGGAIELRSGPRKLVIDSRFNAFQHLLREIEDRTQKHPIVTP